MGSWNVGIYHNDTAMEFVSDINKLYKEGYSPLDIVLTLNSKKLDNEEVFVLGDFKMDTIEKIFYVDNFLDIIEDECDSLDRWKHKDLRKAELDKLKNKFNKMKNILDNKNMEIVDVKDWIKEKRGFDILAGNIPLDL